MDAITIQQKDLPRLVRIIGPKGNSKLYELLPARSKCGAVLNAVSTNIAKHIEAMKKVD